MSNTTFVDGTTTIVSSWLNDVNDVVYDVLGDGTNVPTTTAQIKTNLAINNVDNTSDATKNAAAVSLTNKTINLGSNIITGTKEQFDAACSDGDFVYTGVLTGSGLTVSATDKILGRSSSGAGAIEEITCTSAGRAILDDADAAAQRTTLGLGTAATANTGTSAGNVVVLDGSAKLPAVDGSQLTGVSGLPTQTGNSGKYLTTDGSAASWGTLDFTLSSAASGYQKLPSGLIIQWGVTGAITGGSSVAITFPIAFPNAGLNASATYTTGTNTTTPSAGSLSSLSTTGVTVRNLGATSNPIYWLAIGY